MGESGKENEFLSPLQLLCENDEIRTFKTKINPIPPPAVFDFNTVDEGNCSPNYIRSSMYILPSTLSSRQLTSSIPIGMVLNPLHCHHPPLFTHSSSDNFNEGKEVLEDIKKLKENNISEEEVPMIQFDTKYDLETFRCFNCSAIINNSDYFHNEKYKKMNMRKEQEEIIIIGENDKDSAMKVGKMEYRCSICLQINKVPAKLKFHTKIMENFLLHFSEELKKKNLSQEVKNELEKIYLIKEKEFKLAHSKLLDYFAHLLEYKTNYIPNMPKPILFNGTVDFLLKSFPLPPLSSSSSNDEKENLNLNFKGTSLIYIFLLDVSVFSQRAKIIFSFIDCLNLILSSNLSQPLYLSIIIFDSQVNHFSFKPNMKKPNLFVFPFSDHINNNNEDHLISDNPNDQFPFPIDQFVINYEDKKDLIKKVIEMLISQQYQNQITDKNNCFGVALLAALKILKLYKQQCKYCSPSPSSTPNNNNKKNNNNNKNNKNNNNSDDDDDDGDNDSGNWSCKCRSEVISFLSSHPSIGVGSLLVKNSSSNFRNEHNEKSRLFYEEKIPLLCLQLKCSLHLFLFGNHKFSLRFFHHISDKTNGKIFYFPQFTYSNDNSSLLSHFSNYFLANSSSDSNLLFTNAFNCKLQIIQSNLYEIQSTLGNFIVEGEKKKISEKEPTKNSSSSSKLKQLWEWGAAQKKEHEKNFVKKIFYFNRFDSNSTLSIGLEFTQNTSAIHQFLQDNFSKKNSQKKNNQDVNFDNYSNNSNNELPNEYELFDNHKFTIQSQCRYYFVNNVKKRLEKRLRVNNLNLPISHNLTKLFAAADLETIQFLLFQSFLFPSSPLPLYNNQNIINNNNNDQNFNKCDQQIKSESFDIPLHNNNNLNNNKINNFNNNNNNNDQINKIRKEEINFYSGVKNEIFEKLIDILIQYQKYSIRNNNRRSVQRNEIGDLSSSERSFIRYYPLFNQKFDQKYDQNNFQFCLQLRLPSSLHLLPIFNLSLMKSFLVNPNIRFLFCFLFFYFLFYFYFKFFYFLLFNFIFKLFYLINLLNIILF